jgi:oxygen-independent coproporphyrinogen-3 oxidase
MATFHGYVHVPFCRVRCGYCDFNTYTATELDGYPQSAFLGNLAKEVELALSETSGRKLSTVFFGGGTPTLLPAEELAGALRLLVDAYGFEANAEISTEANPDTVDAAYLERLREAGFNRVSFGMQSAVPEVLKTLDRTHNPKSVAKNVALAQQIGFEVSVDLIYGAPGESMEQWQHSVQTALEMGSNHISAYALILEPATKLARAVAAGLLPEPDEDLQADKYEWLDETLGQAGFDWYELSNWSKTPETASKHNIAYWQGMDWWGFGPGAHSHIGGERWANVKHPTTYAKHLNGGSFPFTEREVLSETSRLEERAMLELRLRDGLDLEVIRLLNSSSAQAIFGLIADGLIDGQKAISGRAALTLRGRLLADFVLRRLLGL